MSELREDIISGDWMILAPSRAARPRFLDEKRKVRKPGSKKDCPFEDLEKSGNWPPVLVYPESDVLSKKNWKIVLIPNKYPALARSNVCSTPFKRGLYKGKTGVGTHMLLITRDHNKNFAELDRATANKLFEILQATHVMMSKDKCAEYVSSFFNWGLLAGASVWHPHYQVLTLPIIPSHVVRSLQGASAYWKANHRCVRCDMVNAELREGSRIIGENEHAIAFTPYASKKPFEVNILPKRHSPYFRNASPAVVKGVVALLQGAMKSIKKYTNDPDLNVFIHDAPIDGRNYDYHHWHVEVMPKISIPAGFELSTGIDINTTDPDVAALILRGKKL